MYFLVELLMPVKYPPVSRCEPEIARVATRPPALCANVGSTAPVLVDTAAMFFTAVPWTEEKAPPRYAVAQSDDRAMASTCPLTFGSHEVIVPLIALNENA